MIRVTFKDGEVEEYKVMFVNLKERFLAFKEDCMIDNVYYNLKEIIKIEKQVKDLTLEEMKKLEENTDFDIFDYFEYYDNDGYSIPFISEEKFDEYIDITSIVKGERLDD